MRKLQIKISLVDSHIPIWRRFQITDDYRLDSFHQVLQILMGWWNAHLHEFHIGGRRFGMQLDGISNKFSLEDEARFSLQNFPFSEGDEIKYLYDLKDDWQHLLTIETVTEVSKSVLYCLEGNGHCPYEGSGGVKGYEYLLQVQQTPNHPDYKQLVGEDIMTKLPDYTTFNNQAANRELRKFRLWHNHVTKSKRQSDSWLQLH